MLNSTIRQAGVPRGEEGDEARRRKSYYARVQLRDIECAARVLRGFQGTRRRPTRAERVAYRIRHARPR
jgi:hypothetical protein